jgi:hypothetical protein
MDKPKEAIRSMGKAMSTMGAVIACINFYSFDQKHNAG